MMGKPTYNELKDMYDYVENEKVDLVFENQVLTDRILDAIYYISHSEKLDIKHLLDILRGNKL